jgi:hypothetical protein
MAPKRRPQTELFIDHAEITEADFEWMKTVRFLILWNVKVPPGFIARLPKLWSLDLRGGSATDLAVVEGAKKLQCLIVNQVRGLHDLSVLPELRNLRCLMLYGLIRVTKLPSLKPLKKLERVELGQMRGLKSIRGVLEAPRLRELHLSKKINLNPRDIHAINHHPALKQFDWNPEDVPDKVWVPILEKIHLPEGESIWMEDWFRKRVGYPTKRELTVTQVVKKLKRSVKSGELAPDPANGVTAKDINSIIQALEKAVRETKQ